MRVDVVTAVSALLLGSEKHQRRRLCFVSVVIRHEHGRSLRKAAATLKMKARLNAINRLAEKGILTKASAC